MKIKNWRVWVEEEIERYLNQYARDLEEDSEKRMQIYLIGKLQLPNEIIENIKLILHA